MTETRKLRVFLCHSSQDKPIVRELYQRLNAEGWIDPWLDEEKLLPGQDWDMEIEKAVEATDVVIVCISSNSVTKEGYIQRELKFALDFALEKPEGTIFLVPLRLDDCQPPRRLRSWQYVDYFPPERRGWANERLLVSLSERSRILGIETVSSNTLDALANPSIVKQRYYKVDNIVLMLMSAGKSVQLRSVPEDNFVPLIVDVPYQYWIAHSTVSNAEYSRFVESTKHLGSSTDTDVNIPFPDVEEYLRWINGVHQKDLPLGYILSLPSQAELIRAVVIKNLPYHTKEWTRDHTRSTMLETMINVYPLPKRVVNYFQHRSVFRLVLAPLSRIL